MHAAGALAPLRGALRETPMSRSAFVRTALVHAALNDVEELPRDLAGGTGLHVQAVANGPCAAARDGGAHVDVCLWGGAGDAPGGTSGMRHSHFTPAGRRHLDHYRFAFEAERFDRVHADRVFVMCPPRAALRFLCEFHRLVTKSGSCTATFLVLPDTVTSWREWRRIPRGGLGWSRYASDPDLVVGYRVVEVLRLIRECDLAPVNEVPACDAAEPMLWRARLEKAVTGS